jgi:hypothetical protein
MSLLILTMRPMANFFVAIPNMALHADGGGLPGGRPQGVSVKPSSGDRHI